MTPGNIKLDDLPEGYREVAHELGLEFAVKLIEHFPGATINVPTLRSKRVAERNEEILQDKEKGMSDLRIMRKHGVSQTTLREVLKARVIRRMTE